MNLQQRIEILEKLGHYLAAAASDTPPADWAAAMQQAYIKNNWFLPEFQQQAVRQLATHFLQGQALRNWIQQYQLSNTVAPRTVGIVMAGNIPLVGFHDFLCVFISGHRQIIKLSSKDDVLLRHLVEIMISWEPEVASWVSFAEMLKNCDAYIATGSDNSARYFDYYFGRYPSIIRRNRTSVAVLTGRETPEQLDALADDIMLYFGLGCRNVTQVYVPEGYNFQPLLHALRKYSYFFDHHKYRSNYDYQLAIYIMNNRFYMTNDCIVLIENTDHFSPIGTLHYQYYAGAPEILAASLRQQQQVQAVVGAGGLPFGAAQQPSLTDYADGVDVMAFLQSL
ncbi:MAG: acyl-CoA reductase [Lacibacter sp.]|mgnify:CR=1 FL=1